MMGSTDQSCMKPAHFSTLLKTTTPFEKEPRIEFGKKWKELALPVGAIRIKLYDGAISSIKNVVTDDIPRLTMLDQFSASDRTFIFQLLDGEWITKVDAHVGTDYIHAVRFHTNLRESLWFGSAQGDVRQIAAPHGFIVRSLYGAWGRCLRELGATFVPANAMKAPLEAPTTTEAPVVDLEVAEDDYSAAFSVSSHDLGAVVINVDPDIKWIRVLSHSQVHQLIELQNGIYPGDHEQWVDLLSDERIVQMEVLNDGDVVVGLRFKTTMRTTPWIGWAPDSDDTQSSHECEPGVIICGFHGARGREGVLQLGCITAKPCESIADEATPALEETCSSQDDESETSESEEETWDVVDEQSTSDDDGEGETASEA